MKQVDYLQTMSHVFRHCRGRVDPTIMICPLSLSHEIQEVLARQITQPSKKKRSTLRNSGLGFAAPPLVGGRVIFSQARLRQPEASLQNLAPTFD